MGKAPAEQNNFDNVVVTLLGPAGTPYCGGRFQLWINFPASYPLQPPNIQLLTKIISPYFTEHGDFHFSYSKVLGGGTDATRKSYLDYYSVCYEIGHVVSIVIGCLSLSPDIFEMENGVWSANLAVVNHKVDEFRRENKELFESVARRQTQTYAMLNWMGPSLDKCSIPLNFDVTSGGRSSKGHESLND
jgi:ubiquitin-protein ligase